MTENSHHQLYNFFIQNPKKVANIVCTRFSETSYEKKKPPQAGLLHFRNEIFMNTVKFGKCKQILPCRGLTAGAQMDLQTCSFYRFQPDRQPIFRARTWVMVTGSQERCSSVFLSGSQIRNPEKASAAALQHP